MLSHIAFLEIPTYHKLVAITDGGMVTYPTLEDKKHITINAVKLFNKLGYENPKVAVLSAVEVVNPKMEETVDADNLKKMAQNGELGPCTLEGPISYDLTFSKESAKTKGYESSITEDVDILVTPNISCGNILSKSLIYSANSKMAGVVVGAKAPIILTSRGATSYEKYFSILLASLY